MVISTRFIDTLRHELHPGHCNSLYESAFPYTFKNSSHLAISYKKCDSSEDSHVDLSSMKPLRKHTQEGKSAT